MGYKVVFKEPTGSITTRTYQNKTRAQKDIDRKTLTSATEVVSEGKT